MTTGESRPTCQQTIYVHGENRWCGQVVTTAWTDYTGKPHRACVNHIGGMKRRWPDSLPTSAPVHGKLALSTPWARGAFGPGDRIEVENLIPEGWTVGISVSGNHAETILWALDQLGVERARWRRQGDGARVAAGFAAYVRTLAGDPPEPDWLHEQGDPITAAKAEADRVVA